MKRGAYTSLFLLLAILLLVLVGCSKKECTLSSDCTKAGYTSTCVDNTCVRTPIPGACGNGKCDTGENECSCESDCGVCAGAVAGSALLQKTCDGDDVCTVGVPITKIKPVSVTNTIISQGNTFKVTTTFNQPFNFKKDSFSTKLILDNIANFVSHIRITKYELSGVNKDKQNVVLASKDVNKPLSTSTSVADDLHLMMETSDLEGTVTNPVLKVNYEYLLTQGSTSQLKNAQIINPIKGVSVAWVLPPVDYDCPKDCDDNNAGTADTCGVESQFFCEHNPIAGACGNFQCDSNENRCTCATDCGTCSGSAGQYLDMACQTNICISSLKSGVQITPVSLFDDRNIGAFRLNNRYTYNKPFDTVNDRIKAEFTLYDMQATASDVSIETIRVLDGQQELGYLVVNRQLTSVGQSFFVDVPVTNAIRPEVSQYATLSVAFSYMQNGVLRKGTFTKPLEKITFITPGTV